MKVILLIITVMTLVIGASINSMALTLAEQIYAAMFYIMALLSFCTFALLFKGRVNWKCNWLLKECGLEEEAERNRPLPRHDLSRPANWHKKPASWCLIRSCPEPVISSLYSSRIRFKFQQYRYLK